MVLFSKSELSDQTDGAKRKILHRVWTYNRTHM